jgi:hypothetical protein
LSEQAFVDRQSIGIVWVVCSLSIGLILEGHLFSKSKKREKKWTSCENWGTVKKIDGIEMCK